MNTELISRLAGCQGKVEWWPEGLSYHNEAQPFALRYDDGMWFVSIEQAIHLVQSSLMEWLAEHANEYCDELLITWDTRCKQWYISHNAEAEDFMGISDDLLTALLDAYDWYKEQTK